MRVVKNNILINIIYTALGYYPAPAIITYLWNFGVLAGLCLVIQIVSGVGLAMHYCPNVDLAFSSVEHIMRDVNYGWLLRYVHANGASVFFIIIYVHMFRGLYYGSYIHPRESLWGSGVLIFVLIMGTAFMGYVLPWGQMSFWGATVITNLASVIPFVGQEVVFWLWGGFSVDNPTLNKIYSVHFVLPFVVFVVMGIHLTFLHMVGSSNTLGIGSKTDEVSFLPYLTIKDVLTFLVFFFCYTSVVMHLPNLFNHPDNYIMGNPLVTPPHIVPEWYLLPFYAMLRSIPSKLGGVLVMVCSMVVLFLFPFFVKKVYTRSAVFRPTYKWVFWLFLYVCFVLGWVGGNAVKYPYYELGQYGTMCYFSYFCFVIPMLLVFDKVFVCLWHILSKVYILDRERAKI